jgi:hypothetical protein
MTTTTTPTHIDEHSQNRFEARLQAALEIAFQRLCERLIAAMETHLKLTITFWEQEEETLAALLTPLVRDGLLLGVEGEQPHFLEQRVAIDVQPHVQRTAEQLGSHLARQVIDSIADRVDKLINAWSDSNKPIEALGEALYTAVLSRNYAEMIAATETTRAITNGQLLVWRALRPPAKYAPLVTPPDAPAFVVGKRWQVQRGQQVCPICEPLDGMVVGLDEKFERAGLSVDAPPAHPRCRCSLEPVWSNDVFRKPGSQEEDDPCTGNRQCYVEALETYGVIIPEDEFVGENAQYLARVLASVETTAAAISPYTEDGLTPEAAFQLVFGLVEFRYEPDDDFAETVVPEDDRAGARNTAIITLAPGSFRTGSLDERFVVTHELGHVFHNRHGNAAGRGIYGTDRIVYDYVQATDADWTIDRARFYTQPTTIRGYQARLYTDVTGRPLRPDGTLANEGERFYFIPQGVWIAGEYDDETPINLFPNERIHPSPHPKEGFADSFANFMLNPVLLPEDELRRLYFEENIEDWISDIVESQE